MIKMQYTISDRLRVRPITMDDTDIVVRWRNNPRVRDNFLYRGPFTREVHTNWMNTKVASGEVIQFIVEEVTGEASRPIGSVYFRDIKSNPKTAEYGIFIGEDDAAGQGFGNLIASWAVEYARDEMKLEELTLRALADNISAVKSYEQAGYVQYDKKEKFIDGRDLIFMKVVLICQK